MAEINKLGNITAHCPGCKGAVSTFEWQSRTGHYGVVTTTIDHRAWGAVPLDFRLFRCAGCGRGAMGSIAYQAAAQYPGNYRELYDFYPKVTDWMPIPKGVPAGIVKEFREAEKCLGHGCVRAAAGLFRSVLDKTLRANGYKEKRGTLNRPGNELTPRSWTVTIPPVRRSFSAGTPPG